MVMAHRERVVNTSANTLMEQTRVRAGSVASITLPPKTLAVLDMSYHRNLSPGSRRLTNPARASDSGLDPYYGTRHTTHVSPRGSSDRVIPISTQTYINVPASTAGVSSTRPVSGYDTYSGRPRRSSLIDSSRGTTAVNQPVSRSRPTVVQNDYARPASPARRDREYYVTPASSIAPKETRKFEHKKVYSVDDGAAKLVADVNLPAAGERHHRRRESSGGDTTAYRNLRADNRKSYHGPSSKHEKAIEDDDFSYTDPAAMYKDTEPRWRPETRQRRGSLDRGGASRERPASMLEPFGSDPRRSAREIGPPPSQRGWDKIKDLGRSQTLREPRISQSPSRGRDDVRPGFVDPRDPYAVAPRRTSVDRHRPIAVAPDRSFDAYDTSDAEDRKPRHHARRYSATKPDRSVSRRGFGIRPESKDRFGNRSSDESFEQRQRDLARDSGYAEPHRRDTAPSFVYPEQEHRRAPTAVDDRERVPVDRDAPPKQSRRREHERSYEDYESDRDRASGRTKQRDRDLDREDRRERHQHRHDTADREYDRTDKDQRESGDGGSGAAKVAVGGLGAAAAMYGLSKEKEKREDRKDEGRERDREREKEKEREREKERELEWQREREQEQNRSREADRLAQVERVREAERLQELERSREAVRATETRKDRDTDSDRRRRHANSHSDDAPPERQRDAYADPDRGLGFAFEGSGPQHAREGTRETHQQYAEPESISQPEPKRSHDRDLDGAAYEAPTVAGAQMPGSFNDPDEEYRRRMEQVQRELGLPQQEASHSSDSDPDRERRRRERAQRQADRQTRMGNGVPDNSSEYRDTAPPPTDSRGLRGSFDDDASQAPSSVTWNSGTSSTPARELRRRNSILDRPMEDSAGMAQIIDNSQSDRRETRVRIVDPPTEDSDNRPKGILKRPTPKFPDHPNQVREGVAPLKDANKKGIPPGARWTKIDRKLVNPEALEDAKERFEERMDFVIVLRVLTKEEIQKLADRTREIREKRHETPEERTERRDKGERRRKEKDRERREKDEYSDHSEDEYAPKAPRMLEAPASAGQLGTSTFGSEADFVRENRERRGERERDGERVYAGKGGREAGR
ncbi:hypothetical protein LTR95_001965 [Oleoguttula sp. CCFEE 5521]